MQQVILAKQVIRDKQEFLDKLATLVLLERRDTLVKQVQLDQRAKQV